MVQSRYSCPVDGCTWTYDEPGLLPDPRFEGNRYVIPSYAAIVAETERALALHQTTHSTEEYLRTIVRLRQRLHEVEHDESPRPGP